MTKQQLIEKAWGQYYDLVKEKLDHNGMIPFKINLPREVNYNEGIYHGQNGDCWGPLEMQAILKNNGWYRIDEHDLPTKEGKYECWSIYNTKVETEWFIFQDKQSRLNNEKFWRDHYTHWRNVEQVNPPIY